MMRIPVIVGIGELIDRPSHPNAGLEPVEILEHCARLAQADAGGACLRRVDVLRVVNQISWAYQDLPATLARRLRLRRAETIYGPVGGDSPVRSLLESAIEIANGDSEMTLLCGAEAMKTVLSFRAQGRKPPWSAEDPSVTLPRAEDYVSRQALRYGLVNPIDVYPLYENATRAAWQQSFQDAQRESGELWSDMARHAALNPCAWSGKVLAPEDIITPSAANRPVAFPYQKFMVAQIGVNQGAAILITHIEAARELGVAPDRMIFLGSGAFAHEPYDFLQRARYDAAPALERVLRTTLEANGLSADDLDLFELYSCFPCVPKLARRALGLPAGISPSVTGGLTFFGGPGNNYMTHAIAAMVRALRAGGQRGLLYGNGEFLTKHQGLILSRTPLQQPSRNLDLQAAVEADCGEVPVLLDSYAGTCVIETFSVKYDTHGNPDRAAVIARTPRGERLVARVAATDPDTLATLVSGEDLIGRTALAYDRHDGLVHLTLQSAAPTSLPICPLQWSILEPHIALVTLNRPHRRNAIDSAVTRLLADYVRRAEEDPEIRVVVLAAAGDTFCAGADLSEVAAGHANDLIDPTFGFAGFVNAVRTKPWIAAVQGNAMGGGTEIALACDLIVAAHSALFGLPEVRRGLLAAAGGAYRLARSISPRQAMELLLTGEGLTADAALGLGLANRVATDDALLGEALTLARRIVANAPLSVAESRRLCAAALDATDASLSRLSLEAMARLMTSEDAKEGVRAFLDKRLPNWKAR